MNVKMDSGMEMVAFVAVTWTVLVTVYWMAVAWRAMRAHERLAEAVDRLAERPKS